ncbi:MAG: hypothetical protein A2498_10085 [Lentisphaerae bacterium RIFOXYC12_FULL_60_16]|nr:MAG: hypothetical protein A2498_10085 [Lentisphaerae bacterium RIFOXYC12_FULL_60_16]OGV74962.1 MAG: hypothetical protein A2269_06840 [Lentisphaerae bacterium RIFOXYA12_FULL_60_10]OGV84782.1 MAG: hypothetical protein A2340_04485 [Lentisphaerae bacterium RIFOXYB12_FULL_60_10]
MTQACAHSGPDENRRMFDRIARRYDLLNAVLSLGMDRRWRRRAVQELAPHPGCTVLDVGCGTADMMIEILRQCPQARVTGIDVAQAMLALAARKLARAGLEKHTDLLRADATATGLPTGAFDGLVTAFCLRNIADRPMALGEFHRLLADGGKLVILDLTRPKNPLLRFGHRLYNHGFVPLVGRALGHHGAYRYLVDSIDRFIAPETVLAMLAQAGFADARSRPLSGGIVTLFCAHKET